MAPKLFCDQVCVGLGFYYCIILDGLEVLL
jgi:hypothetical protein